MRIAVIGIGSMGRKHLNKYSQFFDVEIAAVVDVDFARAQEAAAPHFNCAAYASVEDLLGSSTSIEAASITAPTNYHARIASLLIQRGIACLIEKPLAKTTREARQIVELVHKTGTIVQVGHIERYNPAIRAVQKLGIRPLVIKGDRVSRMSFRSLDVDVILDVMIHDLDLALLFTGDNPQDVKIEAMGLALGVQPEHMANARLSFPSGCLVELNASRIALSAKREFRLFSNDLYISIDCKKKRATLIRETDYIAGLREAKRIADNKMEVTDELFRQLVQAEDLVSSSEAECDPLSLEIRSFIDSARTRIYPAVGVDCGLKALELAERVSKSIQGK